MSAGFGFSIGDFIALVKLVADLSKELSGHGDSAPSYQALVTQLDIVDQNLRHLTTIHPATNKLEHIEAIQVTAQAVQTQITAFRSNIQKFEPYLGNSSPGCTSVKKMGRQVQWKKLYAADVAKFTAAIYGELQTLGLLFATQILKTLLLAETDRQNLLVASQNILSSQRFLITSMDGITALLPEVEALRHGLIALTGSNEQLQRRIASLEDLNKQLNVSMSHAEQSRADQSASLATIEAEIRGLLSSIEAQQACCQKASSKGIWLGDGALKLLGAAAKQSYEIASQLLHLITTLRSLLTDLTSPSATNLQQYTQHMSQALLYMYSVWHYIFGLLTAIDVCYAIYFPELLDKAVDPNTYLIFLWTLQGFAKSLYKSHF